MLTALAPALLVLLFACWCGTFGNWTGGLAGGTTAVAAAGGQLLVLVAGAWGLGAATERLPGEVWWDPWRLGRAGRFLPLALAATVVLAWSASPVPRAGRVALVLLPAFFGVPAAVARAWRGARRRRIGTRAVALVVAAVALESLVEWALGGTARAADPLGHHLLLAAWLALLLPLAVLPWREGGAWRAVAGTAGLGAVAALFATRSLSGALALGVEGAALLVALVAATRRSDRWGLPGRLDRRGRFGRLRLAAIAALVLLATVPLAPLLPRLARVLAGTDPSARARAVYWRAGWAGIRDRPVTGLGPGATAWTLADYLRPIPGVNPPGEVVGELHLLPLEVAYELGLPGLALAAALVLVFAARRLRELRDPEGPAGSGPASGLLLAGLAGLAGGAAAGLGTGDWRIGALPVAAAVAAGAALAGGRSREDDKGAPSPRARRRRVAAVLPWAYALAAALLLAPLDLAQRDYDLATVAPPREAVALLGRAVVLDPDFPVYRARRAWLEATAASSPGSGPRAVRDAFRAAEDGRGVAVLWLGAGEVARRAAESPSVRGVAAAAFERACVLQPLGAFAPFGLLAVGAASENRPVSATGARARLAARTLAADPRLAAATLWAERPAELEAGLGALSATGGLAPGWRQAVVTRIRALRAHLGPRGSERLGGAAVSEEVGALAVVLDAHPEGSVSLHLFRRLPWRKVVMRVAVRSSAARELAGLPAATELPGTDPALFPPTCGASVGPQSLRKSLWKSR